jgi:hypothetical protein
VVIEAGRRCGAGTVVDGAEVGGNGMVVIERGLNISANDERRLCEPGIPEDVGWSDILARAEDMVCWR